MGIRAQFEASCLRRRIRVILIVAILATLSAYLTSFVFTPRYTSQSVVLVEEQKVPEDYVKPVITEDLMQRIATIEQKVLSQRELQSMVQRLDLAKHGRTIDEVIEQIQQNVAVEPLASDINAAASASKGSGQSTSSIPGFGVSYTADNSHDAQEICSQLTSMMLSENLNIRQEVAKDTTAFLQGQLKQAQRDLDDHDAKLAFFKKQHFGQLPGDEDSNLKILTSLNSELEADTQTLNRAQQDRAYAESLLAQQLAAWQTSQSASNRQTLLQQLIDLQAQLIDLQAGYAKDTPDVIKIKADIAQIKKKINDTSAKATDTANDKESGSEPPEIRQLRLQIHQYDQAIAQATRGLKRLQGQINIFQGRVAISPGVEEEYKLLTRDYDTTQKFYNDLLAKKSESEEQAEMERQQLGERMLLVSPATLPEYPDFPNRWLFAGGGLGTGLVLGIGLALWPAPRSSAVPPSLPTASLQPQSESPQPAPPTHAMQ